MMLYIFLLKQNNQWYKKVRTKTFNHSLCNINIIKISSYPTHNHTTTQPHNHTNTQPHNHTTTQPHNHTTTQPHNHTTTQPLKHFYQFIIFYDRTYAVIVNDLLNA